MRDTIISEAEQSAYFDSFNDCYRRAAAVTGYAGELFINLAGEVIHLESTSEQLCEMAFPALQHLETEPVRQPDHVIGLWDSASSHVLMPPPICNRSRFTDRGDIWSVMSDRFRFAFHYGEYAFYAYDKQTRQGIFWVNFPEDLPYWSYASPLRTMFHWCMESAGKQLMHAAAIGTEQGAVLLTGEGGIGKSTTALVGLGEGMLFAGDDYVVAGMYPRPTVYPLYCSAKTNRSSPVELPHLRDCMANRSTADEKNVYRLYERFHTKIPPSMPLAGIMVPNVVDRETTAICPDISEAEIIRKASFTTVSQLPYSGKWTYSFIEQLSRELPGYRLDIGRDKNHLVQVIKDFIALEEKPAAAKNTSIRVEGGLPSLSVVVPVYNREHIIEDALDNILAQKYPNMELIVVNDGSTDDTGKIVESYSHDIRYFSQSNGGPSSARNRGLINATGEFVAFLDSDDIWLDGVLACLVQSLVDEPGADVAKGYSQLARHNPQTGQYEYEGSPRDTFPDYITGAVFRRSVFDSVGLFDTGLKYGEDIDWFNRAREQEIGILRHDFTSVIIRRHDGNMTRNKDLVELNVLRVFKKSLDRKREFEAVMQNLNTATKTGTR